MTWGDASAASCMASPRTFTIFRPVSKSKTPATVSATYSPKESPATAWQRSIRSGLVPRNFSMAARPPTYMAGWQNFVCSSLDSGPLMQRSSRSQPRIFSAVASISFTAGRSFTLLSIFTYCEPWPGKSRPTSRGGSAGTRGFAATTGSGSSSSSSGTRAPVPYLFGSKPHISAAPGRLEKNPFAGFLPNSQTPYCLALLSGPNGM
mmetsp:Transcript_52212/g.161729  ORF Transcript_52212/g.161729 Transcript_52212/m.161729 type:complete len:206 (-) Transcript_52212:524-1141(-)